MDLENVDTIMDIDAAIRKGRGKLTIDDLVDQLKDVLSNVWEESTREALISTISTLKGLTGPVTKEEIALINDMVGSYMGMGLDAATKKTLIEIQEAAYLMGAGEAIAGTGASIAWGVPDQKALAILDNNLRYWIGTYYDDNIRDGFNLALQELFEGGYDRRELAKLLKDVFQYVGDKGDSYWNFLADHIVTQTREIGRVTGYEQANIEVVRIKARIDDNTTETCKRLHGHVIAVSSLRSSVNNYLSACETQKKEKIKAAWPWFTDKDAEKKMRGPKSIQRLVKRGKVGLPPYHGGCRTITVAEFFANPGDHESDFFDKS